MRTFGRVSRLALWASLIAGCNDTESTVADTQPSTSAPEDANAETAADTPTSAPEDANAETAADTATSAPVFLTFNTNTQKLASDEVLVFTAILTHPGGASQVIGGTLLDPGTGSSYGAFITQATQGAYTLSLTWSQINAVAPIDAPVGGGARVFRARFFDQSGHDAAQDLSITLVCATETLAACAGECVDLANSREHCGACGTPTTADACRDGVPSCNSPSATVCTSGCVGLAVDPENCGECSFKCPDHGDAIGSTCEESHCGFRGPIDEDVESCAQFCQSNHGTCVRGGWSHDLAGCSDSSSGLPAYWCFCLENE